MTFMAFSGFMPHTNTGPDDLSRPSPLRNRCAPDGTLHAVAARGTLMGNRGGRLHRDDFSLGRARWRGRTWIFCRLEFKDRQRTVMRDGYTEIFFLDEATAHAAGHRPCYECRRAEARAFADDWAEARGLDAPLRAGEMDRILHAQRLGPRETVAFGDLPTGAIFADADGFFLRTPTGAERWTFDGYRMSGRVRTAADRVTALTPPIIRAILRLRDQSAR